MLPLLQLLMSVMMMMMKAAMNECWQRTAIIKTAAVQLLGLIKQIAERYSINLHDAFKTGKSRDFPIEPNREGHQDFNVSIAAAASGEVKDREIAHSAQLVRVIEEGDHVDIGCPIHRSSARLPA